MPVLVLAALGNRSGIVPAEALLPVLVTGFALGLAALGVGAYALIDIWNSGAEGTGAAIGGIVYALPALALLGSVAAAALVYPRVTDVTTDVNDPPALQQPGDPAAERPDADRFALRGEAYPDLAPHFYALPIADVFSSARALVEDRNWRVVREVPPPSLPAAAPAPKPSVTAPQAEEADAALSAKATMTQSRSGAVAAPAATPAEVGERAAPREGLEAATLQVVARTPLFGFADDVVLRLVETPEGTTVDMRSASGTGMHDLGQNARRIRRFFADLDAALQPDPNAPPRVAPAAEVPTAAADPGAGSATPAAAQLSAD